MRITCGITNGIALLTILTGTSILSGQVPALFLDQSGVLRDANWMIGYTFQINREITVVELGKLDANGNGILDDVLASQIGLWNSTEELLASATISPTTEIRQGGFFSSIPPTTLVPGEYAIGVQTFGEQEPFLEKPGVRSTNAVDIVRARLRGRNDFELPPETFRINPLFGANFVIDEPIALFGPTEHAVYQRNATGAARVPLNGVIANSVDRVEVRATVMPGFSGQETPWQVVGTSGGMIDDELTLPESGWYRIEARAYQGDDLLGEYDVEKVGAGEVFVTVGQSNSANHGNPPQQPDSELVSAMTEAGAWQPAHDPQPVATGAGGSPWPILGDLLVERLGVPVGFASVGWGGTRVDQWLPGASGPARDPLYDRLRNALEILGPHGARAVLWHQGESDALANTPAATYAERLQTVIAAARQDAGYDIPWGVALASFLPATTPESEARVVEGQLQVIHGDPLVFEGPLTDDLVGSDWRWDTVHFNEAGLREHAQRWADAISATLVPEPACLQFAILGMLLTSLGRGTRPATRSAYCYNVA